MITATEESRRAGKSFFLTSAILGVLTYLLVSAAIMFFASMACSQDVATWLAVSSGYLAMCFANYLLFRRSSALLWAKAAQLVDAADDAARRS